MGMVVISDESLKLELCGEGQVPPEITWTGSLSEVPEGSKVVADLLFENSAVRIASLKNLKAGSVIINDVVHPLTETDRSFVRMNGWPTFLQGGIIECSGDQSKRPAVEEFFSLFGKKTEWLADEAGFITPRVVAMIINEAFFAVSENVSSKEDINTAMKLGTNYPYGPFEWGEKIGLERIHELLTKLSKTNPRYNPAPHLTPLASLRINSGAR